VETGGRIRDMTEKLIGETFSTRSAPDGASVVRGRVQDSAASVGRSIGFWSARGYSAVWRGSPESFALFSTRCRRSPPASNPDYCRTQPATSPARFVSLRVPCTSADPRRAPRLWA